MRIARTISFLLAVFLAPVTVLACFQVAESPIKYVSKQFAANFSYEGKPLAGASVTLYEKQKKSVIRSEVNPAGWVYFKDVPAGSYKLVFDGPSHEPFDVEFSRGSDVSNSLFISFYADYCHAVTVRAKY